MKLMIASNNEHKIREIKAIVGGYFDEVLSQREAGVTLDVEENGSTFEENALLKAQALFDVTGCAALADDSGLMVDALDGEPGVYSARYAGQHGDDAANNSLLIEKLKDVPAPRTAHFVSAIALVRPGKLPMLAKGFCDGQILFEPRGNNGFGYDPYFLPDGMSKTFAELSGEIKNAMSHRAFALQKLKKMLDEER